MADLRSDSDRTLTDQPTLRHRIDKPNYCYTDNAKAINGYGVSWVINKKLLNEHLLFIFWPFLTSMYCRSASRGWQQVQCAFWLGSQWHG